MSRKPLLFVFSALAVLFLAACGGAFGSGLPGGLNGADTSTLETAPVEGALAPDFELQSLAGETVRLNDLRGHPVLINFWATWCAPCRLEMPAIQARFEQHSPHLVVLAVDNNEPAELVEDFVIELALGFDPLLDPGAEVQRLYQVRGYPSSFFVDQNGVIQVVHIGLMSEDQLDDYLAQVGLSAEK